MTNLENLKKLIIEELNLEDIDENSITDESPIFGKNNGLGLDSLDAVELVIILKRAYGVTIKDLAEGKKIFANMGSLLKFINEYKSEDAQ